MILVEPVVYDIWCIIFQFSVYAYRDYMVGVTFPHLKQMDDIITHTQSIQMKKKGGGRLVCFGNNTVPMYCHDNTQ